MIRKLKGIGIAPAPATPSFRTSHGGPVPQPSIAEKGITIMRLHRLHFSSSPCPHTLAINCPHSQRVSTA